MLTTSSQRNTTHQQKTWALTPRQLCDLECLLTEAYHPLVGFLTKEDYDSVCQRMRLANNDLWPIPITLDVSEAFASSLQENEPIILTDDENTPIAILTVTSCWQPNKEQEALLVFGTTNKKHPGVNYLYDKAGTWYLGGPLTQLSLPKHYAFTEYRHTPNELKQLFQLYGWSRVVAFQTRNPIHRAHYELTLRAMTALNASLLIHPVVGMTKPGDIDATTRILCYEKVLEKYPNQRALLSLLPLAMRMAGPREALWHALIRKNYGATHFIIGRDHAGPGCDESGTPFYEPYAAQQLLLKHSDEIRIEPVLFPALVYAKEKARFITENECSASDTIEEISGTELRHRLEHHLPIPDWFSFAELLQILRQAYPPKSEQGYTLFFTGLSGAGKSTLAKAVAAKLQASQLTVTLLDGDVIRKQLSHGLGFSKEDRETHLQRMGFVAAEITKHKGIAICAAIAPYQATRQFIRDLICPHGGFIEIYISTPMTVCETRDVKGLYKKAKTGLIPLFTGITAPYEVPTDANIIIDTSETSIHEAVDLILSAIHQQGFKIK